MLNNIIMFLCYHIISSLCHVFPQPHHRLALPSKSLPISSQDSVTSDLPTSTQGGGNYGAIGIGRPAATNPVRRSSVPTNTQPKQPHRKTSYGE